MIKKILVFFVSVFFVSTFTSSLSQAVDLKANEKAVSDEYKKLIPIDKIKNIEDLYKKWVDVQEGRSKALIFDIRTEAEFDSGHILGSNNIDSGHAYGIPEKITDPNTEIWVFCRTKNRSIYFVANLYKYGYTNVFLVEGGIKEWAEKGYPLVSKHLGEIKVVKYDKSLKENYMIRENK